jgi:3-hydroxyisobutyrate dehydrogenase
MNETVRVGFLGLGQMGAPMAARLLGKDWQLHVFDPRDEAMRPFVAQGAIAHTSPASVAEAASMIFACLPTPQISLEAALGATGVLQGRAVRIYAEMSTIGGPIVSRIAEGLAAGGVQTVDAPITGGPPAARAGTLAIMVSGAPDARAAVQPMLASIGGSVMVMGDRPGMAQAMKVINNIIMGTNMIATCEGLAMGVKAGLDVTAMLEVLRNGTGQSFAGCEILRTAVSGRFDFGAKLSIVCKDMALGSHESAALEAATPVIDAAARLWMSAGDTALNDQDFTTILKMVEQANAVVVREG